VRSVEVELADVGRRIADLRTAEGWRLADLAEATGYTTSYLSQIERGISIPSLTALATVASALGVEMMALLQDVGGPTVTVTRAGEGDEIRLTSGAVFRVINRLGGERPYTVIVQSLAFDAIDIRLIGERFLVVLSGAVEVTVGGDTHLLQPMGAVHYGAHETHSVSPRGEQPVEVLIVSRPALF
jgi:transcriptional regulator with XRE-family HTH domain